MKTNTNILDQVERIVEIAPDPVGYRLLVMMPKLVEKTDGGIIKPDETINRETHAHFVAMVLKLGEDAYSDKKRYPNGPWCKEGDWVMFRSYTGSRFKVDGWELRYVNDDNVEGVVAAEKLQYVERAL